MAGRLSLLHFGYLMSPGAKPGLDLHRIFHTESFDNLALIPPAMDSNGASNRSIACSHSAALQHSPIHYRSTTQQPHMELRQRSRTPDTVEWSTSAPSSSALKIPPLAEADLTSHTITFHLETMAGQATHHHHRLLPLPLRSLSFP